ncbi:MAG: hypothetical protein PHX87_01815 [Candidatus Peribacteraceae bacterium]|nr:hypothetical protein [Candidatus Peribacteraceae bacterium]MDD5742143.1 hypothetical protein [Candidatus Peribacteraceae bacterium]
MNHDPDTHRGTQETQSESPDRSRILENSDAFLAALKARIDAGVNPAEAAQVLRDIERTVQATDRKVEIYTDPDLDTFCCAQVPSKRVTETGEIAEDPQRKTYLIGIPFLYVAGNAPRGFIRGEIYHELGHAFFTNFARRKRLHVLATQEGIPEDALTTLDNCVEDPRMERLVGGPLRQNERHTLFEKNRLLIIPKIALGLKGLMASPAQQFCMLLKLERLWALHAKELEGVEKPWKPEDLHPSVREEYAGVEPVMARITGDASLPPMKVNAEVEQLLVQHLVPAIKRLLQIAPWQNPQNGGKGKGQGQGQGTSGSPDLEANPLDPNDTSEWPEELKQFLRKMTEQHQQRLEKESKERQEQAQRSEQQRNESDRLRHELLRRRDNFDDPALREQYQTLARALQPVINRMNRVFDQFLPKIVEPQYEYGRKGFRFAVRRFVRSFGTGKEQPMQQRTIPEKSALVLQILIDVSGSMYEGNKERIQNAVKAAIAACEAAKGRNIRIEILASDDHNIGDPDREVAEKYLIKDFSEAFDGRVKSRIVTMMSQFGGKNRDAEAIDVAVPRIKRTLRHARADADRVGSLMVFISDSTTQSEKTRLAAAEARKSTPFEGTAITPEQEIVEKVRYHFGPGSRVPRSVEEFPEAFQEILKRHIMHLKAKRR